MGAQRTLVATAGARAIGRSHSTTDWLLSEMSGSAASELQRTSDGRTRGVSGTFPMLTC